MASPQLENGYTKISNEIMDALISTNLSGQEFKIALLIIRKTYGFNKTEDAVSLSQMVKATGMIKVRCSQVVNRLELMKILTVTENINGIGKKYKFNKDFNTWEIPLIKTLTVTEKLHRPLMKSVTTKETITKENIKEIYVANADALRLAGLMYQGIIENNPRSRLANNGNKQTTINRWAEDIDKLMRIDKQEPSTVEEVITFATHDNFWGANILSGKKLREKWDQLTAKMKKPTHQRGGIEKIS